MRQAVPEVELNRLALTFESHFCPLTEGRYSVRAVKHLGRKLP